MGAIFVAALTGYVWMGEGGAAAFALAGLWGCLAAARPWEIGRAGLLLVLAAVMVVPGALWAAGVYRPDFAEAVYAALEPCTARMLDLTRADDVAHAMLLAKGDLHCWPAIRLGVAITWLCALPAAAAIVLWFKDIPSHWPRAALPGARLTVLLALGAMLVLTTALLIFPPRRGVTPAFGAVAYPGLFCLWLLAIAGLRAWGRWASGAPVAEQSSIP